MKVSVVLPVYNAQNTLERAIISLLDQAEVNQIILVDDGSTDDSLSICKRFVENYPQILLIENDRKNNLGAPASRNLGLKEVKNTWVQFMDADDELLPGKIADQLSCINGNEAIVVGKFMFHWEKKNEQILPNKDVWSGLINTRLGMTSSNLWNVEWVRKVGGWDQFLPNMQEYFLMFELLKRGGKVVFSEGNLTHIYSQPNSITNTIENLQKKRDNYFVFRQKVKDYLISKGKFNFIRRHYYEICTGNMLRYHTPPFPVNSNKFYFSLYRLIKIVLR